VLLKEFGQGEGRLFFPWRLQPQCAAQAGVGLWRRVETSQKRCMCLGIDREDHVFEG
jgi:hypothetical protein